MMFRERRTAQPGKMAGNSGREAFWQTVDIMRKEKTDDQNVYYKQNKKNTGTK